MAWNQACNEMQLILPGGCAVVVV